MRDSVPAIQLRIIAAEVGQGIKTAVLQVVSANDCDATVCLRQLYLFPKRDYTNSFPGSIRWPVHLLSNRSASQRRQKPRKIHKFEQSLCPLQITRIVYR